MLKQASLLLIIFLNFFKFICADTEVLNSTNNHRQGNSSIFRTVQIGVYIIIWFIGSVGGLLVIYVILFNNKLKTITNTFLLNLAIADLIFLQGIPFYLTSLINRQWIFSLFMCKLFWTFTGVNQFTAVFILTLLAFDRYLAVCRHDLSRWRKKTCSKKVLISLWSISIIFMLPIILYSSIDTISIETSVVSSPEESSLNPNVTTRRSFIRNFKSCTILWPENDYIQLEIAFIFYSCLFSFFIPIFLISVFYFCIIFRLRKNKQLLNLKPASKRKDRRKATYLVLIVISIYVITYTPYWIFQVFLLTTYIINTNSNGGFQSNHQISAHLSSIFQFLVYLNSTLNPFFYAFISEVFRKSFKEAIKCKTSTRLAQACFSRFLSRSGSKRNGAYNSSFRRTTEFNSDYV
ncbi:somatostatin receptor type 2-like [Brachionus plicatilis]|uniref:Somatostatin receptor type 2-like n=1 Tax=Brachionus plicatilis TaxID=10195 RepID=A0A3M7RIG6_BRAPC|nr:somatostatin receptor type 2-like [Brachionus plicatilis]